MWYIVLLGVDLQEGIPVTMSMYDMFYLFPFPFPLVQCKKEVSFVIRGLRRVFGVI
jgi:hypothetical protein